LKLLQIALLLAAPPACEASPLEDAYFAARDDFVAKIKAIDDAGKLGDAAFHRCFAERARGQAFFSPY
jgi:hypothetical protein